MSKKIHQVSGKFPEGRDLDKAWEEIEKGSDRSAAIMGAAFVENALQDALKSRTIGLSSQVTNAIMGAEFAEDALALKSKTIELSSQVANEIFLNGPLSSFSSKILLGFALGLYGPVVKKDLNVIRNIRNAFAHAMMPITFDSPEVADELNGLAFLEWRHKNPPILGHPASKEFSFPDLNRDKYENTVRLLAHSLYFFGLISNIKRPDSPKLP
jgi:hypothetical protein